MIVDRYLSPKELAQAIGASESSLKRWADDGLIHVTRTAGGHRRIALREAIRYIRESGIPVVDPVAIGLQEALWREDPTQARESPDDLLTRHLMEGDGESACRVLLKRFLAGDPVAGLCDGPILAALRKVGDQWKHNPEWIVIEHRTTDACIQALQHIRSMLPARSGEAPVALGGSPSGDPYLVPSLMAAVVCAAAGWREINLGPNLPVEAFVEAFRVHRPRVAWISFTVRGSGEKFTQRWEPLLEAARAGNIALVAGGQGLPPRNKLPADVIFLSNMEALTGYLRASGGKGKGG